MTNGPELPHHEPNPEPSYRPEHRYRIEDDQLPGSTLRVRHVIDDQGNRVRLETFSFSPDELYVFNIRAEAATDENYKPSGLGTYAMASLFVEAKARGIRSITAHAMSPYFIRIVQRFAGDDAVEISQRNSGDPKQGGWLGTTLDQAAEWIRSGYRNARQMSRNALDIDINVDLIPDERIDHAREIIRTGIIPKSGRSFGSAPSSGGAVVEQQSRSSGTVSISSIVSKLQETIGHTEAALVSLDAAHDSTAEIEGQATEMELSAQAGRAAMLMERLAGLRQQLELVQQAGATLIAAADQIRHGNKS